MIAYSIVILLAWFSCVWFPIWIATSMDNAEEHITTKHHFMKG